ncbi:site-2 protease family protein [candidate division WWE3 bacterium]|nr:site-2 protease family protein [candidate division WWE3 bacterium]
MTVLIFLLVISSLILIHEFGHFIVAKWSGVKVEEFALGMGPRILKVWNDGETEYAINLLPIGGYVRLYGEDQTVSGDAADSNRAFGNKPIVQRMLIIIAGVVMNYLLGVLLIAAAFAGLGEPIVHQMIQITGVSENTPAAESQLKPESYITGYRATENDEFVVINSSDDFLTFINTNKGRSVQLQIVEPGIEDFTNVKVVSITPRQDPPEGQGPLGIQLAEAPRVEYKSVAWYRIPDKAIMTSISLMWQMFQGLGDMFAKLFQGVVPQDVAGPIGIAKLTGEVAKTGFFQLLQFSALISFNLALLNLLPFPALDGGRLAFIIAEGIVGRKVLPKYEPWIHGIGLLILLGLMVVISYYDIVRFF